MQDNRVYDIAVMGGGAAGTMAAIRASENKRDVVLLERNNIIGKKILLTGNGRCNLTNTAPVDIFIDKFSNQGKFLRTALYSFSNVDLMEFFRLNGLELKVEKEGCVFPSTNKASSVTCVLEDCLKKNNVDIIYETRINDIKKDGDRFILLSEEGTSFIARKVIVATGGASYKVTGSSGDGFDIAKRLGHTIIPLKPALVALKTKEAWVEDLQGLSLSDVRITFHCGSRKLKSYIGEMIFTHFGVSGPIILDMSRDVVIALFDNKEINMSIDFEPSLNREELKAKLADFFNLNGSLQIRNLLENLLPKKLVITLLANLCIFPDKHASQITKKERNAIVDNFKALTLTIVESLPIDEAMVANGGVSTKEIEQRTMESKVVPGLYFCGEVIDGRAPSGGYNLQQAFSTGYLAGQSARDN